MQDAAIPPDAAPPDTAPPDTDAPGRRPSLGLSLLPLALLIGTLALNVWCFGDSATQGPNQLALLGCALVTLALGVFRLGRPYAALERQIVQSISLSLQACLILLVVGSLIGLWILAGIVPTLLYYGLQLIHPALFLPVACLACSLVALATGSSWSTTGTLGVALVGIGQTLGIPEGMVAGAILSGAYFGDKMSPLSDTTNLAPAMAGSDLFTHIRHMAFTSGPAMALSLVGFTVLGLTYRGGGPTPGELSGVLRTLEGAFVISPWLLLVPLLVVGLVARRVPALPALAVGAALGALAGVLFQSGVLEGLAGQGAPWQEVYAKVVTVAHSGFTLDSGSALLDKLLSRGGMAGMLPTVWLILMAMVFGGALEGTGMLAVLAAAVLRGVRGAGSLVGATLGSCILLNVTASDQYLSIVVPGRMFRHAYEAKGLAPQNLSRALEDGGTVTSVLVPWNTCGAYNSGVLGVATSAYAPYAFFNWLSPLVSLFVASMGWTLARRVAEGASEDAVAERG